MYISAGIDKNKFDDALKNIKKELSLMNKITANELNTAKKNLIHSLKAIYDNQNSIIHYYYSVNIFDNMNIEDHILNINKLTIEDINNLNNKISLDTIFLLYGDDLNG